jgi:hypothetical protein
VPPLAIGVPVPDTTGVPEPPPITGVPVPDTTGVWVTIGVWADAMAHPKRKTKNLKIFTALSPLSVR